MVFEYLSSRRCTLSYNMVSVNSAEPVRNDMQEQKVNELTRELDVEKTELKKAKEELDVLNLTVSEKEEALATLKHDFGKDGLFEGN